MKPKQKSEKKLPRRQVIERQTDRVRKVLDLDQKSAQAIRGGAAQYGLPQTRDR